MALYIRTLSYCFRFLPDPSSLPKVTFALSEYKLLQFLLKEVTPHPYKEIVSIDTPRRRSRLDDCRVLRLDSKCRCAIYYDSFYDDDDDHETITALHKGADF